MCVGRRGGGVTGSVSWLKDGKTLSAGYICSCGGCWSTRTFTNSYLKTRTLLFPGQLVLYAFGQLVLFNWSTRTF